MNHFEAAGALHVNPRFGGKLVICRCEGCSQAFTTFTDCSICSFRDRVMWWPWSEAACGLLQGRGTECQDRFVQDAVNTGMCLCVGGCVCMCVCAKGKVDINNLCCIYFYLLMSPPCGPVFMLFLQINFAPLNNSACKWHEDLTELHELRNPQILQSDINCTQNVLINRSMVPIPCFCILMYTVCTNINI